MTVLFVKIGVLLLSNISNGYVFIPVHPFFKNSLYLRMYELQRRHMTFIFKTISPEASDKDHKILTAEKRHSVCFIRTIGPILDDRLKETILKP